MIRGRVKAVIHQAVSPLFHFDSYFFHAANDNALMCDKSALVLPPLNNPEKDNTSVFAM